MRILADNFVSRRRGVSRSRRARDRGCRAARVGKGRVPRHRGPAAILRPHLRRSSAGTRGSPRGAPRPIPSRRRTRACRPSRSEVDLPPEASMEQIIDRLWRLPRDLVSDGFDTALPRSRRPELPMTVHEFPSGTECWTWLVPEKWTCHEAYLETLDGRRLLLLRRPSRSTSCPTRCRSKASSRREELFRHLHVHAEEPRRRSLTSSSTTSGIGGSAAAGGERDAARTRVSGRHPDELPLRDAQVRRGHRAGRDRRDLRAHARTSAIRRWSTTT